MKGKPKITGKTKVFGIFGWPVRQSLSPVMHNAAFGALGLDHFYLPFAVRPENLLIAIQAILPLELGGVNVTVPHKEVVVPHLQDLSPDAALIGAVNTIEVREGRLIGHNTDGYGFVRALRDEGFSISGRKATILGAGGAARAVTASLAVEGLSSLTLANRTADRASALSHMLQARFPSLSLRTISLDPGELHQAIGESDIVVNTTSVGLKPGDPLLIPEQSLRPGLWVYDLIYNPQETLLLRTARRAGAKTVNGLGMLLHQGVMAFEIWTGRKAPVEVMRRALEEALGNSHDQ